MEENKDKAIDLENVETDEECDIIELVDDEGNVVNFYHLATFEHKGEMFVVFEPTEKSEDFDEGEAVIFKLDEDEAGNDVFSAIESEEKLQEVFDVFMSLDEEDCCCGCEEDCDCEHHDCDCDDCKSKE